jgi:hypothetical protein
MERYELFCAIARKQKFFFYLNCIVPSVDKKHIGLGRDQHTSIRDMEFEFDIKAIGVRLKLFICVQTRRVDIVCDNHFRFSRDQSDCADAGSEPEFRNMPALSSKPFQDWKILIDIGFLLAEFFVHLVTSKISSCFE